jgi:hypothetical protein
LRHVEELSNAGAAKVLGLAKTAARSRYMRAIKRLKDARVESTDSWTSEPEVLFAMTSSTSEDGNPLDRLVEEFVERQRRGEHPAVSEYAAKYPELAGEIRELFPMLAVVERFKPAPAELAGPSLAAHRGDFGEACRRLGDYRILRTIGIGGMGMVYEAERESLTCRVALKVMHPEFRSSASYLRRFHTEARSAARLHHTNIVGVFDFGEHDGVWTRCSMTCGASVVPMPSRLRRGPAPRPSWQRRSSRPDPRPHPKTKPRRIRRGGPSHWAL